MCICSESLVFQDILVKKKKKTKELLTWAHFRLFGRHIMHVAAGVVAVVGVMIGMVCGTPARSGIFGSVVVPQDVTDVENFYKHTKIILNGGHHVVCDDAMVSAR